MSKREAISRYNLIIKKVRKQPVTLSEIMDYLKLESEIQGYNFNVSQRTFQRDLEEIRSIYNIEIKYDFSRKIYYIDYEEQPDISDRIMEAFDVFNSLNLTERLSDYIHFEKRKSQGTENLYGILHAIKNTFQISFNYHKFWENDITERNAKPYALKEFKNRWYLIALDLNDDTIKSFALDRLRDLEISKKHFVYPVDFNITNYYKFCFGIVRPNEDVPEEIILSLTPFQGRYIKSLPLHESQEILIDNEKELRIRLKLYLTYDFIMELLSMGENLKILQPKSLINQLIKKYQSALNQY